jgi:DNA-binding PadR family transcriptional regulator
MEHKDLLSGFIRIHILHHASQHEIYGQWIIEELARHGYRLSPRTLYPMLHAMERRGYLSSQEQRRGRSVRRLYRATKLGRDGLALARIRLKELTGGGRKKPKKMREPDLGVVADDERPRQGQRR